MISGVRLLKLLGPQAGLLQTLRELGMMVLLVVRVRTHDIPGRTNTGANLLKVAGNLRLPCTLHVKIAHSFSQGRTALLIVFPKIQTILFMYHPILINTSTYLLTNQVNLMSVNQWVNVLILFCRLASMSMLCI